VSAKRNRAEQFCQLLSPAQSMAQSDHHRGVSSVSAKTTLAEQFCQLLSPAQWMAQSDHHAIQVVFPNKRQCIHLDDWLYRIDVTLEENQV